jgi:hypothetical protein
VDELLGTHRVIPVRLRTRQQVNMIGEQLLQFSFRGVAHGGRFREEPSPTRKIESDMPVMVCLPSLAGQPIITAAPAAMDPRALAESAIGQQIPTVTGRVNTILRLAGGLTFWSGQLEGEAADVGLVGDQRD